MAMTEVEAAAVEAAAVVEAVVEAAALYIVLQNYALTVRLVVLKTIAGARGKVNAVHARPVRQG